jgi:hypothetical protein
MRGTTLGGSQGPARRWARRLWAALILAAVGVCGGAVRAQATDYAALTQTTVSQLVSALDLYRRNRTAEAQAQLSRLGPGLAQLKGVADHYRDLANAEHDRCMTRVVELEQRTSDLYQEEEKVEKAMGDLDAEIAGLSGKVQVAGQEVQRLNASLIDISARMQERERKLKELTQWWWVPGYGQYLAVRTLADKDIEAYKSEVNSLTDQNRVMQDQQQAVAVAEEARRKLAIDREASRKTVEGLRQMRTELEADLGRLKASSTVLTEASVLWGKATNLLTQTGQDQLGNLETMEQLLQESGNVPDFTDAARDYAGDLQSSLLLFARSVDNGSNFLGGGYALCGGPPRDPNAPKVSKPCSMVEQITQYYEIVDPVTCSFRYTNPPGCPPFPTELEVSDAAVTTARASGAWTRAAGENWVGRNRCRATAAIYYGQVDGADTCEATCMTDPSCKFWTYNERNGMMPNSRFECWGGRGEATPQRSSWGGFTSGGSVRLDGLLVLAHHDPQGSNTEQPVRSKESSLATSILFKNSSKFDIKIYWIDYSGEKIFYRDLPSGQSFRQETFYTHPWLVTDSQGGPKMLFFAGKEPGVALIE